MPARSPAGQQAVTPRKLRADFEWERDQGHELMAELGVW